MKLLVLSPTAGLVSSPTQWRGVPEGPIESTAASRVWYALCSVPVSCWSTTLGGRSFVWAYPARQKMAAINSTRVSASVSIAFSKFYGET